MIVLNNGFGPVTRANDQDLHKLEALKDTVELTTRLFDDELRDHLAYTLMRCRGRGDVMWQSN